MLTNNWAYEQLARIPHVDCACECDLRSMQLSQMSKEFVACFQRDKVFYDEKLLPRGAA